MSRFVVKEEEFEGHSPVYVVIDTVTGLEFGSAHVTDGLRPEKRAQERADHLNDVIPDDVTESKTIWELGGETYGYLPVPGY